MKVILKLPHVATCISVSCHCLPLILFLIQLASYILFLDHACMHVQLCFIILIHAGSSYPIAIQLYVYIYTHTHTHTHACIQLIPGISQLYSSVQMTRYAKKNSTVSKLPILLTSPSPFYATITTSIFVQLIKVYSIMQLASQLFQILWYFNSYSYNRANRGRGPTIVGHGPLDISCDAQEQTGLIAGRGTIRIIT